MNWKRISFGVAAALGLAGLVLLAPPSTHRVKAAATVLCAPNPVEGSNVRTIGGAGSAVPSGTLYSLNGQGCVVVAQADVGYFLSIGFTAGPPFAPNCLFVTGVLTGTTDQSVCVMPPATYIQHIMVQNTTANAVTGGISFGTTANGTDIVTAQTCAANCLAYVTDANIAKRIFSTTAQQVVHAAAVTAWNSANVTITVVVGYF